MISNKSFYRPYSGGDEPSLEAQLNEWRNENPDKKILSIQSGGGERVSMDSEVHYSFWLTVWYEDGGCSEKKVDVPDSDFADENMMVSKVLYDKKNDALRDAIKESNFWFQQCMKLQDRQTHLLNEKGRAEELLKKAYQLLHDLEGLSD